MVALSTVRDVGRLSRTGRESEARRSSVPPANTSSDAWSRPRSTDIAPARRGNRDEPSPMIAVANAPHTCEPIRRAPRAFQDVTVTPLSPFTLQPGMSYWIVVTANADWSASSPEIRPTGIATSLGYRFGTDPPTGPESIQVSFHVDGTPVSCAPCPSPPRWPAPRPGWSSPWPARLRSGIDRPRSRREYALFVRARALAEKSSFY